MELILQSSVLPLEKEMWELKTMLILKTQQAKESLLFLHRAKVPRTFKLITERLVKLALTKARW
jgi:hypothetical protein